MPFVFRTHKAVLVVCIVAYVERVVGIGGPVEIVLVGLVIDIRRIVVVTPLQFGAPGDPDGAMATKRIRLVRAASAVAASVSPRRAATRQSQGFCCISTRPSLDGT